MDTTSAPNFEQLVEWLWNMPHLLGLKLTKSLVEKRLLLIEKRLSATPMIENPAMPMIEKPRATNFPFTSILIGRWRRVSSREGDLTAKLYFAKRKLIWEFLDGGLKSKIEVCWDDITAINAYMPPNQPGTLQIELGKTPLFFRETNPQPKKHTSWKQASDFTSGYALHHRIHYVTFPHGELDIHYPTLLQCDQNLFDLSKMPFPSQGESPYFNTAFSSQQIVHDDMGESSDAHQTVAGMANHHKYNSNSFHEASFPNNSSARAQQQVLPRHHMSYAGGHQLGSLYMQPHCDGGPFLQFNQIQNNSNNINGLQHPTLEESITPDRVD